MSWPSRQSAAFRGPHRRPHARHCPRTRTPRRRTPATVSNPLLARQVSPSAVAPDPARYVLDELAVRN